MRTSRGSSSSVSTHSRCSSLGARIKSLFPSSVVHSVHLVHYSPGLGGVAWSLDQVFVLGGAASSSHYKELALLASGGRGLCPGTFCKSQGGSGCDVFCAVLRCYTLSVGARGCLPGCVWHGAILVCAFAEGVEGIRFRLAVFANVRVRVCHVGLAVRPHHPFKDATTQSLATVAMGTPSWLCPSEQMAIGIKSSETGVLPPSTTTAHKRTPGSMAPVPPRLRAGAAPVAWHAVPGMWRNTQSNRGQRRASPTALVFGHTRCTTYSFGVRSIHSLLAILLLFPSAIILSPCWHLFGV